MTRRNARIFSFFVVTVFMLACVMPSLAPAPTPLPTFDPNSLNTAIVETANAAATQTALMMPPTFTPTATPRPTFTPTGTATPTFIFMLPTLTFTSTPVVIVTRDVEFACQIVSQSPLNNDVVAKNTPFDVMWEVVNVGTKGWNRTNADYLYISGAKIHQQPAYDFDVSVPPLSRVELRVKMWGLPESGTYITSWKIRIGKNTFCPMDLTVVVN